MDFDTKCGENTGFINRCTKLRFFIQMLKICPACKRIFSTSFGSLTETKYTGTIYSSSSLHLSYSFHHALRYFSGNHEESVNNRIVIKCYKFITFYNTFDQNHEKFLKKVELFEYSVLKEFFIHVRTTYIPNGIKIGPSDFVQSQKENNPQKCCFL